VIESFGIPDEYVSAATERARGEVERRTAAYRAGRGEPDVAGRTVVVVDDGVATGSTLIAVLRAVRAAGAAVVICAVPVGPPDTIAMLGREADVVICPNQPASFRAVGMWYDDFSQLTDREVQGLLGGE
jgi:predicted phosphoribosyltransferase